MQLFTMEKSPMPIKSLRDKYLVPPFSILDSQVGGWLKHRNEWETVLKNRANNIRNQIAKSNTPYINKFDYDIGYKGLERNGNISTFDPFLCEILVRWFSLPGMTILDPFAGGHVRGVVSGVLHRNYVGVDVNGNQVEANKENLNLILDQYETENFGQVSWVNAASQEWLKSDNADYDMVFMCPPYYNLEIYSDNPLDISTCKTYEEFLGTYREIIKLCHDRLSDDSFAVAVVEEIRRPDGIFYGFVPDTIRAFTDAGFLYYNELILENRIMSLGVRCPKYFEQSRKVGRHHQNVLVFYKGNPKNIENKFGKFSLD